MLHNKHSINIGVFPSSWKIAKVTPVQKSGSVNEIENYDPVSIISVVSKIMEKEVHNQFSVHLGENKLISDFQFGFRKNKSTELAAVTLVEEIRRGVDSGYIVGACFSDLRKVFDTISHAKLVSKLTSYAVNGIELEWFRDYLFNRKVQAMHNKCLSESNHYFLVYHRDP